MKFKESMIMWKPDSANIKVMSRDLYLEEVKDINYRHYYKYVYPYWVSGTDEKYQDLSPIETKLMAYLEMVHIVIRDKVDLNSAHKEFLKIDEYVDGLASDLRNSFS
jgi:hypothetical protein